jgi:hypothetical protein
VAVGAEIAVVVVLGARTTAIAAISAKIAQPSSTKARKRSTAASHRRDNWVR